LKKLLYIIVIIGIVLYFNKKNNSTMYEQEYIPPETVTYVTEPLKTFSNNNFACDGRKYCSEMTSCEEATYFLNNCPDPRMDGNNDGVPCESQWCN
jgi:hypothetical protein